MVFLSSRGMDLHIDVGQGFVKSLKYHEKEYIGATVPLFMIALRDREGRQTRVNTFDMTLTSHTQTKEELAATYDNGFLGVRVSVKMDAQISWGIEIAGMDGYAVEWVNYPQIAVPDDFKDRGGSSRLLWGFNEGTLIDDITAREQNLAYFEPEYPCKGIMGVYPAIVETQFMAYYNEHSGMYLASHDKDDNLKGIDFLREGGGVKLEFRHFSGADIGEGYTMDYPMVIEFFKGDWHDAAEIYRDWFKAQKKSEFIPISQNAQLPKWYGESPVVITYPVRGRHDTDVMTPNKLFPYINVMPHVERLEKAFNSRVMVLLMHWEGTAPWAPPIVWPPYGGEAELKKLVDALHARGDVLGVYCSGIGWTIHSKLDDYDTEKEFVENGLVNEMCLSPEQELPFSNICTAQRSGYDMCPTREFTVKTVKGQVERMVDCGIDYIQLMDQNHGGTSYFCYSKKHGHPYIPGRWQVDAVKRMLREVHTVTGKTLLGCESAAAQSYIPYLLFSDNRFNLAYYIGRPVPMYAYVYHEYLNNFLGNQVCVDWTMDVEKAPESFYERMAHAFIAGDMLTVVITENGEIDWNWGKRDKSKLPPNQEYAERLIRNLNGWRTGRGKKYLHTGRMVKPLPTESAEFVIPRRVYGASVVPSVHTSAWTSDDGSFAQFLVNYFPTDRECTVTLDGEGYALIGTDAPIALKKGINRITVPPLSAVMIEKASG